MQRLIICAEAFACTGWRVGYLIGPPSIIFPTLAATTRIVFCSNSPLQEAAAAGLEQAVERKFFETQTAEYAERREILCEAFDALGLTYYVPDGTYFVLLVSRPCAGINCAILTCLAGYLRCSVARRLPVPQQLGWPRTRLPSGVVHRRDRWRLHDPRQRGKPISTDMSAALYVDHTTHSSTVQSTPSLGSASSDSHSAKMPIL